MSAEAILKDFLTKNTTKIKLLEAKIQFGLGELSTASKLYEEVLAENDSNSAALLGKAKILAGEDEKGSISALKVLNKIQKKSNSYNEARILIAGIQAITKPE